MTTSSKSPAERRRIRREEAAELRERGHSTRQIADFLGVSTHTVRADLHAMNAWPPVVVTGRDGKAYPATAAERKKRQAEKRKAEPEIVLEPVVSRCAYCDFVVAGDVGDARQAFVKHVCSRPPPPAVSALARPRRRGWRTRK
jgi:DNA-binding transcriptional regulator YhcF (GntR family)